MMSGDNERSRDGQDQSVATVVVSQEVKPGLDAQYEAWQENVNQAVRGYSGFLGTEVISPVPGVQKDWVVIYRFDTPANLKSWMDSDERRRFLAAGEDLFARPAEQTAMAGGGAADEGVTLVVSQRVKPGREAEFQRVVQELQRAEVRSPGNRGAELLPPVAGVQHEWTSLVRFDTREHLEAWMQSEEREAVLSKLEGIVERYDVKRVGSSFGSWFSFTTVDGRASPNWKQAMVVLLVLYPIVMLESLYLTPWLSRSVRVYFYGTMFVANALSVAALTWILMPVATRALHFWLRPDAKLRATVVGVLLVLALYALSLIDFWQTAPHGP